GWQGYREQLVLLVDFHRRLRQRFAIDRRLYDFELECIQDELMNWAVHAQLHRFRSSEHQLVDIGDEPNGIFYRDDLFRQLSRCSCKLERFFCMDGSAEHKK